MKKNVLSLFFFAFISIATAIFSISEANAQTNCDVIRYHGQGYSTRIFSVINNWNGTYTIVLIVENDGCPGPACKKMNHYAVEADPGTYSNISVQALSGAFTFANIDYGPTIGGIPFQGFRISNANGMGNGQAASFSITYTLTGALQDQQTLVKASSDDLLVSFSKADFESVLNCGNSQFIHPYYRPPYGGKIYNSLIGAELTSLYYIYADSGYYESDDIFQVVGNQVAINVFAKQGKFDSLLTLLQTPAYGLQVEATHPDELLITGYYPIPSLLLLNGLPSLINYALPDYPGETSGGLVTSQGDTALLAYVARNGFRVDGTGIKIGVLSDSYNTQMGNPAGDDILRGDLPGVANPANTTPVDVLEDYPYGIRSDEGRAMLQIIHDIAPKATLAFRTGFLGAPDFANGIRELKDAGCDVIVDDITYLSEPFLRDGIVAQAVEEVVSQGVAYFSAAGNFGSKSYQANFAPYAAPAGLSGMAHDFSGTGDIFQNMTLPEGSYTIVLQWDDGTGFYNTGTDLDIYLARENGSTLFGFNRVNTGGAAIEVLPFNVSGGNATSNLLIVKASGASNVYLKYIIFRGNAAMNEYFTGSSTVIGQANAENAIAVGAVLYSNTPEYGVNPPTIASFSSRGGTPVNGVVRIKPEIAAPNGVNTTVDLGGVNIDGDLFPNFFGTSASAPHAAGVAALIIQAKSMFYNADLSPVELRGILQSTAIDMDTPGFDFNSGFGFIQADAALSSLANPSPVITGIYYDTTLTPGVDPIPISVTGQYLTSGSVIYFNGQPLTSGTTVIDNTLLSGTIPVFDDRYPPIQVYNPPKPGTNGTDGGLSNALYFNTKKTIVVDIEDKSKKFGEVLPEFTAVYYVDGPEGTSTLEEEGLTTAQTDRVMAIPLVTVATALSNTGIWGITASASDPLNPASTVTPSDPLDIGLLENYNFEVDDAFLTIEKLELLIKPRDTAYTYGTSVSELHYDFIYNNDTIDPGNNVVISPEINDSILNNLRLAYANALVGTIAFVPATALVNEQGEELLDSATLVNTSLMIPEATALVYAAALAAGTLVTPNALFRATALVNAVTKENSVALAPATALVNSTALVNTYDNNGNLISTNALFRATALVNAAAGATALVNSTTINANSNSDAIVILGDGDIKILSGDSTGSVNLRSISMYTGKTVGQHWIIPGTFISNNFNISYGLGRLTINPAVATVTADMKVIYAGDPLPNFTATFSGFINGETDTVVNSLTFTVNPTYNGSAGTYQIIPSATADNYVFTPVNGTLYVNPFGSGTKNIRTSLSCVEQVNPANNGGFAYIAHYKYTNDNATAVYIPIGSENNLSGTGTYNSSQQPQLFLPGTYDFDVPFDGVKLTWTVKSFNGNGHKSSSTSSASSTSSKCNKSAEADEQAAIDQPATHVLVYPNPVKDKLTINLESMNGQVKAILVYDALGKAVLSPTLNASGENLEVNMSGLKSGLYFIRIEYGNTIETVRIVKL